MEMIATYDAGTRNNEYPREKRCRFIAKRYIVAFLIFLGNICLQLVHVNLDIAIVDMTATKSYNLTNGTLIKTADFNWDQRTKGMIISLFQYGVIASLLCSGIISRFGNYGVTIYGLGIAFCAFFSIATPFILKWNFYSFLGCRVIQGFLNGFSYSSLMEVWLRWSTIPDRSKFLAIGLSGMAVGGAISYPMGGFIIHAYGWPLLFYVTGIILLVWTSIWFLFVTNDPQNNKFISKNEKSYLKENSYARGNKKVCIPWFKIFKCKPVIALAIGKLIYGFAYQGFLNCLPLYIKDVSNHGIRAVGMISSLPHIISIFSTPLAGCILDFIQNRTKYTVSQIHKTFLVTGFSLAGFAWLFIGMMQNVSYTVIVLMIFRFVSAFTRVIFYVICMSIAPALSSTINGLSSIFINIGQLLTTIYISYMFKNEVPGHEEWGTFMKISGLLFIVAAIDFLFFASSDKQSWADVTENPVSQNHNSNDEKDLELDDNQKSFIVK